MIAGADATVAGGGGELIGVALDGTVVLAPAGAVVAVKSAALVGYGGTAFYKGVTNYFKDANDLISNIQGGSNAPKPKNKPKANGEPNSVEMQRDANGNITKYTEFGPNGEFKKEVRITGKDHDGIPRPNVKEPNYNINPKTGESFQNGYKVRPAEPDELPK